MCASFVSPAELSNKAILHCHMNDDLNEVSLAVLRKGKRYPFPTRKFEDWEAATAFLIDVPDRLSHGTYVLSGPGDIFYYDDTDAPPPTCIPSAKHMSWSLFFERELISSHFGPVPEWEALIEPLYGRTAR